MSELTKAIDTLFSITDLPYSWTEAEEAEVIRRAKAKDETAVSMLIEQYALAMKRAIQDLKLRHFGGTYMSPVDLDDVRQNAVLGILEAIQANDPERNPRLAGMVRNYLQDAILRVANPDTARIAVPKRTLTRFFSILREADGNPYEAARIAPEHQMAKETFLQVLSAVREVVSLDTDNRNPGTDAEGTDHMLDHVDAASIYGLARTDTEIVEDALLVRAAFAAVDMQEAEVIRHSYGFHDYEAQSDAEVAHRLGLSRPKVQRVRAGGLAKMRVALGVA